MSRILDYTHAFRQDNELVFLGAISAAEAETPSLPRYTTLVGRLAAAGYTLL